MHSNLKKGLFLVTFLGMTVSPGISVMAADGDTAEAAKMPGVGIEAVLKDFYSQNRLKLRIIWYRKIRASI